MPADKIAELREQRATLIAAARAILDKAESEKRDLNAEEDANHKKAFTDIQALKDRIDREERQRELDREAAANQRQNGKTEDGDDKRNQAGTLEAERKEFRSLALASRNGRARTQAEDDRLNLLRSKIIELPEHRMFQRWLQSGKSALTQDELAGWQKRNLQMDIDTSGGAMVPPEQFMADLIRKIDDYVYIRQFAKKITVTKAQDLGVPSLENNPSDFGWTSELATGSTDTTMSFGKRQFQPHPLAKQIQISNKLLRASVIDVEELVRDRFAYVAGITMEIYYMTGTGAGQPLGLFTASSNGIDTSRDTTSLAVAAIGADDLMSMKYTLKAPYRPKASWLFNRTILEIVAKLKDGDGQYLWRPGLIAGTPDMILGMPVSESEYVPNTYASGNYVAMLGDYSNYWIADALDMTMQRLDELYAATNQTGFIWRMETDGMPVLAEPFVRLILQ